MNIYAALARGETFETILPPVLQTLGADILMITWIGDEEALVSFRNASLDFLEELKEKLAEKKQREF